MSKQKDAIQIMMKTAMAIKKGCKSQRDMVDNGDSKTLGIDRNAFDLLTRHHSGQFSSWVEQCEKKLKSIHNFIHED